jgi:protein SCO1/2
MKIVVAGIVVMLVVMGCCVPSDLVRTPVSSPEPTLAPKAIFVERPIVPPDVPMLDQDGRPAKLSNLRGKFVFVTISNIECEEACVDALPIFTQIKARIGSRDDVKFLMIGTDIKADSPAMLKRYLAQFDASFLGFTAETQAMRELVVRFGIHSFLRKDGALAPHAPFTYLLDKEGQLVFFFQNGLTAQQIIDATRQMIDG